mgnify:FL=1
MRAPCPYPCEQVLFDTPASGDWTTVNLPWHDFVPVKNGAAVIDADGQPFTVRALLHGCIVWCERCVAHAWCARVCVHRRACVHVRNWLLRPCDHPSQHFSPNCLAPCKALCQADAVCNSQEVVIPTTCP